MKPLHTGLSFAVTVVVFYSLCALAWFVAPDRFMTFMNNLFHGLDFTPLIQPRPFAWSGFLSAALVMGLWTFFAGTFFGWISKLIARKTSVD